MGHINNVNLSMRHLYLTSDVWGHRWGWLGVDVGILGHEARIMWGDTAEAVGSNAPRWWRLVRQAAAVATGGGGWWGGRVGQGASATNTTTTTSPWRTGGTTVGAVYTAVGGGRCRGEGRGQSDGGVRNVEVMIPSVERRQYQGETAWLEK